MLNFQFARLFLAIAVLGVAFIPSILALDRVARVGGTGWGTGTTTISKDARIELEPGGNYNHHPHHHTDPQPTSFVGASIVPDKANDLWVKLEECCFSCDCCNILTMTQSAVATKRI